VLFRRFQDFTFIFGQLFRFLLDPFAFLIFPTRFRLLLDLNLLWLSDSSDSTAQEHLVAHFEAATRLNFKNLVDFLRLCLRLRQQPLHVPELGTLLGHRHYKVLTCVFAISVDIERPNLVRACLKQLHFDSFDLLAILRLCILFLVYIG